MRKFSPLTFGTSYKANELDCNQIDMMAVSTAVTVMPGSCTAWHDFTMPTVGKDHVPTAMRIKTPTAAHKSAFKRRKVGYDRNGVKDPVKL